MKTDLGLDGVGEIEVLAGINVVYLPHRTVIRPRHAALKKRFEMGDQGVFGAADQFGIDSGSLINKQPSPKVTAQNLPLFELGSALETK